MLHDSPSNKGKVEENQRKKSWRQFVIPQELLKCLN